MLGDRIGRRRVIYAGLAAVAIGDLAFLLTGDFCCFPRRRGHRRRRRLFSSSQTALLSEIVPPHNRTWVLSGYRFSSDLGALIGPILLAVIMDTVSVQAAIGTASAILLLAALAARLGVPALVDDARRHLTARSLRPCRMGGSWSPMTPDDVVARIDPQEVVDLALALGNIDSPTGSEGRPASSCTTGWRRTASRRASSR